MNSWKLKLDKLSNTEAKEQAVELSLDFHFFVFEICIVWLSFGLKEMGQMAEVHINISKPCSQRASITESWLLNTSLSWVSLTFPQFLFHISSQSFWLHSLLFCFAFFSFSFLLVFLLVLSSSLYLFVLSSFFSLFFLSCSPLFFLLSWPDSGYLAILSPHLYPQ